MSKITPSWLSWPETKTLISVFGAAELRFVGGAVRDALLARDVKDVDAATVLLPDQVITLLTKKGIKAVPTGIDHGTVTAVIEKKHFEITTLRRDIETYGRHAKVAYTEDWKEDAARRDFTMNALYCDAHGTVFDYFGGADDTRVGHVRFIGNAEDRISEDGLRILRFFRFFAHYGKDPMDAEGLAACGNMAARVDSLSGERIQQEMMKLLMSERAGHVVDLMQSTNVWRHVVSHTVKTHALKKLPHILAKAHMAPDALLALALLLRSAEGDAVAFAGTIAARWKLSKAASRRLQTLCASINDVGGPKEQKKAIRALGKELFIEHVLLLMAEGAEELHGLRAVEFARIWKIPQFPVNGNDLASRGIKPGKQVGTLLKELEEYWEEQDYAAGKEDLLARVG